MNSKRKIKVVLLLSIAIIFSAYHLLFDKEVKIQIDRELEFKFNNILSDNVRENFTWKSLYTNETKDDKLIIYPNHENFNYVTLVTHNYKIQEVNLHFDGPFDHPIRLLQEGFFRIDTLEISSEFESFGKFHNIIYLKRCFESENIITFFHLRSNNM